MTSAEPQGRLQVVAGPMFAGKSEELLRRVRRARLAGLQVELINHALDDRQGSGAVASHAGASLPSHAAVDVATIHTIVGSRPLDLLAIDEAQFFGPDLVQYATGLATRGTTVVVAGLCVMLDGRPFAPIPGLMALAEDVTKLTAVCTVCGADAAFHQRTVTGHHGDAQDATAEFIGGSEAYQARCRRHFHPAAWAQDPQRAE